MLRRRWANLPLLGLLGAVLVSCSGGGEKLTNENAEPHASRTLAPLTKGSGGVNGDIDYCNDFAHPCAKGEGDCDSHAGCMPGLWCGEDLGPQFGFRWDWDVCVPAHCVDHRQSADETGVDCGGADCGNCVASSCPANNLPNTCSSKCRCAAGSGDCDGNLECQPGLVCATAKGAQFGLNKEFDVCVPSHCANGSQDGDETGVDCGGADCGTCQASCTDGVRNGFETDVDCGGSCSTKCADKKACIKQADCQSGLCVAGTCRASHCKDGVQNADEVRPDCGGADCTACSASCPANKDWSTCSSTCKCTKGWGDCDTDAECEPGMSCAPYQGLRWNMYYAFDVCVAPHCANKTQDADETGLDCGGADCGICTATCADGLKNDKETDIDCGGPYCPKCVNTKVCRVGTDCASGNCASGVCQPVASCSDQIKNGSETDVDCGGSCSDCANGRSCVSNSDCVSGLCTSGQCVAPPQAVCGNGVTEAFGFEECDDGNTVGGDGCSAVCQVEGSTCGNGVVEGEEQCDDSNTAAGDGCVGCQTEGVPGDGVVNANEQCDDGNVLDGDGCSHASLFEDGTLLDFEGLGNQEAITSYYNGGFGSQNHGPGPQYGITFGSSALSLIDADAPGGGGNFGGEPSPSTIVFFLSGSVTVNVPNGFRRGFSFYYTSPTQAVTVRIFDGLNGTGNLLRTIYLPQTVSDSGDPGGAPFSPFYPVGVTFPGMAKSVDFGGAANKCGFDDIRFNQLVPAR